MTLTLRPLLADDWPAVYHGIWQPVVAAGGSYLYPRDTGMREAEALWCLPAPARVVVAEEDGAVVATAVLRPNQPGAGSHVANASFMVAPARAGRGVGRWLAQQVLQSAREQGYRAMQFNAVLAANTAAVALWDALGFEVVGRIPDGACRDGTCDDLLIMFKRL